ncbi:MAG: arginase family protein [Acidobacteriota bacterium]|jgi:agmatinase
MVRDRRPWFDLERPEAEAPDVAIFGLPFDGAVSRHAGAGAAPARLRELSRTSDAVTRKGDPVDGLSVRDFGDLAPQAGEAASCYLERAYGWLRAAPEGAFRIYLGGDNSVSVAAIRDFAAEHGPGAGVLWFDAHPDLFEAYDGDPFSHACALRRPLELGAVDPAAVTLLATRSFSREELEYIRRHRIAVITAASWLEKGSQGVLSALGRQIGDRSALYLAIDIDGFDPAAAPGTGYPIPAGIPPERFFRLLVQLFERFPVRAMDLTEIAPSLDTADRTGFLGVQVVLESLGHLARKGREGG